MLKTNVLVLLVAFLAFSIVFVGSVHAISGDSNSSYTPIPQVSPTPTFDPNATSTPTPTPSPNSTVIYVGADRVQSINPNGNPISLSTYNHTTVYLTYAEADSYSINFTGASNRLHNEQQSPTQISVAIDGIGTYHFIFTVLYDHAVNTPITLSVYSSDGTSNIFPLANVTSSFTLEVVITTNVLPHYPTAEEQEAARAQSDQDLYSKTISYFDGQQTWMKIAIIIAIIVIVVVVVVLVLVLRHQRHTDYEINNQNAQGWGRGRM